jgi:integrase
MPRKPKRRTWGTGSIFERDDRWWIRWRSGGRRKCRSFISREVAEKVLLEVLAAAEREEAGMAPDPAMIPTIGELAKAWLERRQRTNRTADNDVSRWKHIGPTFDKLKPHEVNAGNLRRFVEDKLAEGLNPATVKHCVSLLSSLFTDLHEQGLVEANPIAMLTRATRKLFAPTYDVSSTPFLSRQEDIERLFKALESPYAEIFALSSGAGLRPAEAYGLAWADVDMEARTMRIHQQIQRGRLVNSTKTGKARLVPISTSLAPVLAAWRLKTGGQGLVFKGLRTPYIVPSTVHDSLRVALVACGLPKELTLYQCGRHTYASRWVMNGGSMELLAKILGHSSTAMSHHYAHLAPNFFGAGAHDRVTATFTKEGGKVLPMHAGTGTDGQPVTTAQDAIASQNAV